MCWEICEGLGRLEGEIDLLVLGRADSPVPLLWDGGGACLGSLDRDKGRSLAACCAEGGFSLSLHCLLSAEHSEQVGRGTADV